METSELISQKACELFLRHGIRSVTMDELAAHLGMAKKTIYKHFENKDALVETFIQKHIEENKAGCKPSVRAEDNPVTGLFLTLMYAQRLYLMLNPFIIRDLERNHNNAYQILENFKEECIFSNIKNSVESGVNQHYFEDAVNVNATARFFMESLGILSNKSVFLDITSDLIELSHHIFGYIISGIATSAGMEIVNYFKTHHRYTALTSSLHIPFWDD